MASSSSDAADAPVCPLTANVQKWDEDADAYMEHVQAVKSNAIFRLCSKTRSFQDPELWLDDLTKSLLNASDADVALFESKSALRTYVDEQVAARCAIEN